jgi:hypothetical protein
MQRGRGPSIQSWALCAMLVGAPLGARAATDDGLAVAPAPPATGAQFAASPTSGPAAAAEEVTIYVNIGPIHSDVILPRSAFADAPPPPKAAAERTAGGPWIVIGWGPYWFGRRAAHGPYHFYPWLSANAIYTEIVPQHHSQLRMAALEVPGPAPKELSRTVQPIRMSPAELAGALARINESFVVGPDGGPVLAEQSGTEPGVVIYQSNEVYHLSHECNHWVGEVLRAGGVPTRGYLDLVPQTLDLDLKMTGATAAARTASSPAPRPAG